jgi:similar to stage IV sporulation protein
VLSSFIWSIQITGVSTANMREIERNLSELGVKPGALKLNIAVSEIENNMLIRMGSLSWIKVRIEGTRAGIEVKERLAPPKMVPEKEPCSIIAGKDGIIAKIVSAKGDVLVEQGEPVRKGQVLVTGIIQRENTETRYVHSRAEIKARTWYEGVKAVPFEKVEKVRSGKKKSIVYIFAGNKKLKIKNSIISYKNYDKIEKSTRFIDTDRFQLPFGILIEEYYEVVDRTMVLSPDEAKSLAADMVEKSIIDSMPPDAKIINRQINISIKGETAIASALFETIEDIGVQEEISIIGED